MSTMLGNYSPNNPVCEKCFLVKTKSATLAVGCFNPHLAMELPLRPFASIDCRWFQAGCVQQGFAPKHGVCGGELHVSAPAVDEADLMRCTGNQRIAFVIGRLVLRAPLSSKKFCPKTLDFLDFVLFLNSAVLFPER